MHTFNLGEHLIRAKKLRINNNLRLSQLSWHGSKTRMLTNIMLDIEKDSSVQKKQEHRKTEEENTRTLGAAAGGAILGASIGGAAGAVFGGIIGAALAASTNESKRKEKK